MHPLPLLSAFLLAAAPGRAQEPSDVRWQRVVSGECAPGEVCRVLLDADAARDCATLPDGVLLRDANGIRIPYRVVLTRTATNLLFEAGPARTLVLEGRAGAAPNPPRSLMRVAPADARLMALGPRLRPGEPRVKHALRNLALQAAGVLALLILLLVLTRTAFRRYAR